MLSAKTIPAGGKGQIEAKIMTNGLSGPIEKQITVTTNDPRKPTTILTIKATVEPEIELSEHSIFFDNAPAGRETRKDVILTIPAETHLNVISAVSRDPSVSVRLEQVQGSNGKKLRLIAVRKANLKPNYYFGQIVIRTDSRLNPEITVQFAARVN